jgi:hypothetical protein
VFEKRLIGTDALDDTRVAVFRTMRAAVPMRCARTVSRRLGLRTRVDERQGSRMLPIVTIEPLASLAKYELSPSKNAR